jgi:hypothetical protein
MDETEVEMLRNEIARLRGIVQVLDGDDFIRRAMEAVLATGTPVLGLERIPNEYCGPKCCPNNVWCLVKVPHGKIKIGWRKRVINIDWKQTTVERQSADVTPDDVTKGDRVIHAWGYDKMVEYIGKLLDGEAGR